MKRWFVSFLVVSVILLGTQAPVALAKELKKISLTYSDHIPAMAGGNIWAKKFYYPRINEQLADLGYELDMTFYHASSLYKSTEQVGACEHGLVDMSVAVLPYELARFPLHEMLDFEFMGWDQDSMYKVWADLKENIPVFGKELSDKFFEFYRFIPTKKWLHTNLGPDVRTPMDFKGKKIHCSGMAAEVVKSIGAIPIRQNPGDWYTSLDRGLFDGIIVAFDMVGIMKLWEVLNTHITPYGDSFGNTPVTYIFNKRKFSKLPKEVQQVFINNFEWATAANTEFEKTNLPGYMEGAKNKGSNFVELTAEETDQWRQVAKVLHKKWIAEKEKKGYPAQQMYDEALRLVQKYSK